MGLKMFVKLKDGGPESPVTAYFLIEWKRVFSVALLHFPKGSRENFHSHAFNSVSLVLKGRLDEEHYGGLIRELHGPGKLVATLRSTVHRVWGCAPNTWVLTLRGPWEDTWLEYDPRVDEIVRMKKGRTILTRRTRP